MASEPAEFISNVKTSVQQLEELHRRLETEKQFQKLWETDSGKALRAVGINPDARMEAGRESYERGPECVMVHHPAGNAWHC
jgi:hypothetical protein